MSREQAPLSEELRAFLDGKMESAMEAFREWLEKHPDAAPEQGAEELFQIMMGRIFQ